MLLFYNTIMKTEYNNKANKANQNNANQQNVLVKVNTKEKEIMQNTCKDDKYSSKRRYKEQHTRKINKQPPKNNIAKKMA